MTTQTNEGQNVEGFMTKAKSKSLETALKRFDVKVFLDWDDNEADEIFYVELTSKTTNKRLTFTKSFFEDPKNSNKVLRRLNKFGNVDPNTHSALIYHIHDLIDDGKFVIGGYSAQPLEWNKQVAMKRARLVARNYLMNKARFALQSSKNYDSSKHQGVILDKEGDLPDGVIAVGFKGSTLQSVLNPTRSIQSQEYRYEILGGLTQIGVLDADIDLLYHVEDEDDEDDDEKIFYDGYIVENGKLQKDEGKRNKKKKSLRLDKQRVVSEDKNGVKFYILHFSESLLKEVAQYVAA